MINCFIAVSKRNNLDHGDDIGLGPISVTRIQHWVPR